MVSVVTAPCLCTQGYRVEPPTQHCTSSILNSITSNTSFHILVGYYTNLKLLHIRISNHYPFKTSDFTSLLVQNTNISLEQGQKRQLICKKIQYISGKYAIFFGKSEVKSSPICGQGATHQKKAQLWRKSSPICGKAPNLATLVVSSTRQITCAVGSRRCVSGRGAGRNFESVWPQRRLNRKRRQSSYVSSF